MLCYVWIIWGVFWCFHFSVIYPMQIWVPCLGTCGKDFLLVSILSLHCSDTFPCCAFFAVLVHSIFLPKSRTAFLMSDYFLLPFHLLPRCVCVGGNKPLLVASTIYYWCSETPNLWEENFFSLEITQCPVFFFNSTKQTKTGLLWIILS